MPVVVACGRETLPEHATTSRLTLGTRLLPEDTPRGGALVRPVRLDAPIGATHDVRRAQGAIVLNAVREPWLLEQMGLTERWFRYGKDGKRQIADPQAIYARTLLGRGLRPTRRAARLGPSRASKVRPLAARPSTPSQRRVASW